MAAGDIPNWLLPHMPPKRKQKAAPKQKAITPTQQARLSRVHPLIHPPGVKPAKTHAEQVVRAEMHAHANKLHQDAKEQNRRHK